MNGRRRAMTIATSVQTFLCLYLLLHRFPPIPATASHSPFHFHHFALFGHIHANDGANCELRISVRLGDLEWLQAIEGKYYIVQLPMNNYTGLVGEASLLPCHEGDEAIWRGTFVVQGDIGAYRLNIFLGNHNDDSSNQDDHAEGDIGAYRLNIFLGNHNDDSSNQEDHAEGDKQKVNFYQHRINKSHKMSPNLNQTQHLYSTATFGRLLHENGHRIYPRKVMFHFHYIKKWQIALLVALLAISLVKNILCKGIILFELASSLVSEVDPLADEFARIDNDDIDDGTNTGFASWQLCMTKPSSMVKYLDLQNQSETPYSHGESTFEEAWHVAEDYLNEEIVSNSQGTYFSYNCLVTEHEERLTESPSVLGKWNRDNAGRLIRQLWS